MTSTAHTHTPAAGPDGGRPAPGPGRSPAATGERTPSLDAARSRDDRWPTTVQVWNWVESAVFAGYGPPPSFFV
ncbi:hypothetical protein V2S66_33785 [Streptomyces sp. V4-01]|uniref:Uncharacterized protein n=1 Tax=Actinacidiphila polyblastidii TaxID=3110430 RepID=A0ABU7PPI9_9ACTN|nr:hypothetical protein [Streptomyces sp. V4-01]